MGSATPSDPRDFATAAGQSDFGIPNSRAKVIRSVLLLVFFAAVVFTCGGFINPRWVGWCLIGLGVITSLLVVTECRKLLDRSPVLVFSADGLTDHSRKPGTTILWGDIRKVTLWTVRVNGVPGTRRLILDLPDVDGSPHRHRLDLDTLKGNPRAIAEAVLQWANRNGRDISITLQEGSGTEGESP